MSAPSGRIFIVLAVLLGILALARPQPPEPADLQLPNGRSQREEILKADHEKSLEDAAALVKAAEELQIELEKNDRHVVSVASLKQIETIEKLSKRIKSRLKRF